MPLLLINCLICERIRPRIVLIGKTDCMTLLDILLILRSTKSIVNYIEIYTDI